MNFSSCKFLYKYENIYELNSIFYNICAFNENFYYKSIIGNNSYQLGVCTITGDETAIFYEGRLINSADGLAGRMRRYHSFKLHTSDKRIRNARPRHQTSMPTLHAGTNPRNVSITTASVVCKAQKHQSGSLSAQN